MDIDAYQLVVNLLTQAHYFGESIAVKIEFWISISSGLIVMAYLAPNRLKPGIASLVLAIYIAFSLYIFANIEADMDLVAAALADAAKVAAQFKIESKELQYRLEFGGAGSNLAATFFMVGLFLGTCWFVSFTAYQTHKKDRNSEQA